MVAPAVLPLLGILGAAAGSYAIGGQLQGRVANQRDRVRGDYQRAALDGVDPNDPAAVGNALFGAGLLSGPQYQGDVRTGYEGVQDRQAAWERQQAALAPQWAQIQIQQQAIAQAEAEGAAERAYNDWIIQTHGTPQEQALIGNPMATPQAVANIANGVTQRVTAPYDPGPANEYIETVQPMVNDVQQFDWAIGQLDEFGGRLTDRAFWTSPEAQSVTQTLNQLTMKQRSDYWRNTLGRTDAPTESEAQDIAEMFPLLEPTVFDERRLRTVRQNLTQGRESSVQRMRERSDGYARTTGRTPPQVSPTNSLPSGWSVDNGG